MSTPRVLLALLPALLLLGACGGDSVEDKQEEMVDLMDEATEVLKGVTDKASAEAAKSKLKDLAEEMAELGKELKEKMDAMSLEEKTAATQAEAKRMMESVTAWGKEMQRVMQSEYGSVIADELKKIRGK